MFGPSVSVIARIATRALLLGLLVSGLLATFGSAPARAASSGDVADDATAHAGLVAAMAKASLAPIAPVAPAPAATAPAKIEITVHVSAGDDAADDDDTEDDDDADDHADADDADDADEGGCAAEDDA